MEKEKINQILENCEVFELLKSMAINADWVGCYEVINTELRQIGQCSIYEVTIQDEFKTLNLCAWYSLREEETKTNTRLRTKEFSHCSVEMLKGNFLIQSDVQLLSKYFNDVRENLDTLVTLESKRVNEDGEVTYE